MCVIALPCSWSRSSPALAKAFDSEDFICCILSCDDQVSMTPRASPMLLMTSCVSFNMRLVVGVANFRCLRSGTGGDDCVHDTLSDKTLSSPPLHVSDSGSCDISSPPLIGDIGVKFRGDEVAAEKKLPKED